MFIWRIKEKHSSLSVLQSVNGMILPAMNSIHCSLREFVFQQEKEKLQSIQMEINKISVQYPITSRKDV